MSKDKLEIEWRNLCFDVYAKPNKRIFDKLWAGKIRDLDTDEHLRCLAKHAIEAPEAEYWNGYGPVEGRPFRRFTVSLLYGNGNLAGRVIIGLRTRATEKTKWPNDLLEEWLEYKYDSIDNRPISQSSERTRNPFQKDKERVWWLEVVRSIQENWNVQDIGRVTRSASFTLKGIRDQLGYNGRVKITPRMVLYKARDIGLINDSKLDIMLFDVGGQARINASRIISKERGEVYRRDGFSCACCGSNKDLSVDHIIPVALGGPSTMANLQTLCMLCNSKKHTKIINFRHLSILKGYNKKDIFAEIDNG